MPTQPTDKAGADADYGSVAHHLMTVILSGSEEPALSEVERDLATACHF